MFLFSLPLLLLFVVFIFFAAAAALLLCACVRKIDDKSVAGGRAGERDGSLPPPLTMAELFDEDRLEMMGCRLADYDPARLAAEGGEWLEEYPNPSLSPKAVSGWGSVFLPRGGDGIRPAMLRWWRSVLGRTKTELHTLCFARRVRPSLLLFLYA